MHNHIISPREVWAHTTSYTPPLSIKVPVPSQGIERSCNCLQGYRLCLFYDFDIWFWNCSNSVVFWNCSNSAVFIWSIWSPNTDLTVVWQYDWLFTIYTCNAFLQNILTWSLVVFPFRSLPLTLALHSSPHTIPYVLPS